MKDDSRRSFLVKAMASAAGTMFLAGCGGSGFSEEELQQIRQQAAQYDPSLSCTDTSSLQPGEIATRTSNNYTDHSTQPGMYCFDCENFQPPAQRGTCGTCRTVKGPINPLGYCLAWTHRKA